VDAEQSHRVEHRKIELSAARRDTELDRQQKHSERALEHELRTAKARSEAAGSRRIAEADADATAKKRVHEVAESHAARTAEIDAGYVRSLAEADALRIQAIQRELVGALHAASDSEVMKAAAANMNLVSLLGGKTPLELIRNVVAGTPLERSVRQMSARAGGDGESGPAPVPPSAEE
ncbi:MAG: hypothetical protein IT379_37510, partial [Deltaproteobacteria bacterium]|nr:hypothetical protein [Deltaproteobacteria bacterium]